MSYEEFARKKLSEMDDENRKLRAQLIKAEAEAKRWEAVAEKAWKDMDSNNKFVEEYIAIKKLPIVTAASRSAVTILDGVIFNKDGMCRGCFRTRDETDPRHNCLCIKARVVLKYKEK